MSTRWRPRTLDQQFADQEERLRQLTAPPVPVAPVPDPWVGIDFTPEWRADTVDPVIGDGLLAGHLVVLRRAMFVRLIMVAGASTTFGTGNWYFKVPQGRAGRRFGAGPLLLDGRATVGGQGLLAQGRIDSAGADRIYVDSQTNASTVLNLVNDIYPAAWASGASLELHGMIELA